MALSSDPIVPVALPHVPMLWGIVPREVRAFSASPFPALMVKPSIVAVLGVLLADLVTHSFAVVRSPLSSFGDHRSLHVRRANGRSFLMLPDRSLDVGYPEAHLGQCRFRLLGGSNGRLP